jgi:hypothetical protein
MKNLLLLVFVLSSLLGFTQIGPVDFEASGNGADWAWVTAENAGNPVLEIVDNPNVSGLNVSSKVGKFTAESTGQSYALVISEDIGSFTFDASNSYVTLKVNKGVISEVAVKLEGTGIAKEIKAVNTIVNGDWEELIFDFSSEVGRTYNKLVLIPDFAARTQNNIIYFDDLTFAAQPAGSCDDGILNGDETGIDCGGSCTSCPDVSECAGASSDAQVGSFPSGYTYEFKTLENGDVRLIFALPTGTDGVVARAWQEVPFNETLMSVAGAVATLDISGYTTGTTISYAVKFEWAAGGFGVTKYYPYTVGENCSSTGEGDSTAPTNVAVSIGTVGAFSAELLLNAEDEAGNITYNVTYGEGKVAQVTGVSNTEKSFVISGLMAETNYNFTVIASDASANAADGITVSATTGVDTNTACEGQASEAGPDGNAWSKGYKYKFETVVNATNANQNDVVFIYTLLEPINGEPQVKITATNGTVRYLNKIMVTDEAEGKQYTYRESNASGTLSFSFRAGLPAGQGISESKIFSYTLGEDCSTASVAENDLLKLRLFPSPAKNELKISAENIIENVAIYNALGKQVKSFAVHAFSINLDISDLSTGIYILKYTAKNAVGSMKFIKQ